MVLVNDLGHWLDSAVAATGIGRRRLDACVRQATREMELSYARRMLLEREQAAAAERERIYQDLHDEVGAKLLSLVYASSDARQAAIAREALRAIRSIVSPERLEGADLGDVVADWRIGIETRCEQARFQLEWEERLDEAKLSGIHRYHLDRILTELVSNALEHSGGTTIRATVVFRDGRLELGVEDDGCGFAGSDAAAGCGLAGIRRRVAVLGGRVRWGSGRCRGTRCTVVVPFPPFGG